MEIKKSVVPKATIKVTTQELYDRLHRALTGITPEMLDTFSYYLISGYENNIVKMFNDGLLYIVFPELTEHEDIIHSEVLEISVTNHRGHTFIIKHHNIKNILNVSS